MLKAKDIMTKNVVSVQKEMPVYEAVEILTKHGITGLPVVEDNMTLVGILTEKDVLKLFYDTGSAENKTVRHFMTQPAVSFDENENLLDVCDFLMKNLFRRVPITSEGKLTGIISIPDIIKYILLIRGECVSPGQQTSTVTTAE